jgi:hypothetical protein
MYNQNFNLPTPSFGEYGQGYNKPQPTNAFKNLLGDSGFLGGLGSLWGGAQGHGGDQGAAFNQQLQGMIGQGSQGYMPFLQAGQGAINPFQQQLQGMQNPGQYMNNVMSGYQESPWAKFQTGESQRAANAAAAAGGLTGSTVHQNAAADYARNIASQDQQQYFQNHQGVNHEYLSGLAQLLGLGGQAASGIGNLYGQGAQASAQAMANQQQGKQEDKSNVMGGFLGMLPGLASLFL